MFAAYATTPNRGGGHSRRRAATASQQRVVRALDAAGASGDNAADCPNVPGHRFGARQDVLLHPQRAHRAAFVDAVHAAELRLGGVDEGDAAAPLDVHRVGGRDARGRVLVQPDAVRRPTTSSIQCCTPSLPRS